MLMCFDTELSFFLINRKSDCFMFKSYHEIDKDQMSPYKMKNRGQMITLPDFQPASVPNPATSYVDQQRQVTQRPTFCHGLTNFFLIKKCM